MQIQIGSHLQTDIVMSTTKQSKILCCIFACFMAHGPHLDAILFVFEALINDQCHLSSPFCNHCVRFSFQSMDGPDEHRALVRSAWFDSIF